jgi:Toxin SymE, type I toxin-antitoxin system
MDNTQDKPKRKKKVYYSYRPSTSRIANKPPGKLYPVIHLAGNYLAESGFKVGDAIEVYMKPGKIVITKAPLKE